MNFPQTIILDASSSLHKAAVTASIDLAAAALEKGALVAIPTETVYGLAGNAFDDLAVAKIFAAKERPSFDPLIVHVAADATLENLNSRKIIQLNSMTAAQISCTRQLISRFWPGPLTILFPKGDKIPDLVTSGLPTVAVRAPSHDITQQLLSRINFPLAAPSANRFGRISPTSAQDVVEELSGRIEFVLDGGACSVGLESTIVTITEVGQACILRPGGTSLEQLALCLGTAFVSREQDNGPQKKDATPPLVAPGTLASHYAPRTPAFLLNSPAENWTGDFEGREHQHKNIGVLLLFGKAERISAAFRADLNIKKVLSLSDQQPPNDLEASRNLFGYLRQLDHCDADAIIIEQPIQPRHGLWLAINDRLVRAVFRVFRGNTT